MVYNPRTYAAGDQFGSADANRIETGIADVTEQVEQLQETVEFTDRVLYDTAWPTTRPEDRGKPLQYDDTANAQALGQNTTPPPPEVVEVGDYWWTYRVVEAG